MNAIEKQKDLLRREQEKRKHLYDEYLLTRTELNNARRGLEQVQRCSDAILAEVIRRYGEDRDGKRQIEIAKPDVNEKGKILAVETRKDGGYIITLRDNKNVTEAKFDVSGRA